MWFWSCLLGEELIKLSTTKERDGELSAKFLSPGFPGGLFRPGDGRRRRRKHEIDRLFLSPEEVDGVWWEAGRDGCPYVQSKGKAESSDKRAGPSSYSRFNEKPGLSSTFTSIISRFTTQILPSIFHSFVRSSAPTQTIDGLENKGSSSQALSH